MVASTKIAVAKPSPIIFTTGSSVIAKPPTTEIMMSAADVITRAVVAIPVTTARSFSPWRTHSSRTRESRNTS